MLGRAVARKWVGHSTAPAFCWLYSKAILRAKSKKFLHGGPGPDLTELHSGANSLRYRERRKAAITSAIESTVASTDRKTTLPLVI